MWRLSFLLLLAVGVACGTSTSTTSQAPPTTTPATTAVPTTPATPVEPTPTTVTPTTGSLAPRVRTGATVLVESGFAQLDGLRVGLIAHQVSLVKGEHLGDLLHAAPNVELVAMFGPEHGVRGDADAGEYVEDAVDQATGVPVYSLFGPTRQPTAEMLAGIDVLLYDLQDVGTRYYTYISTMGLAMQAAAEADVSFVVLDRPNPLGGDIGGGTLDPAYESFVGFYPIPDVYGLTSGELARWASAEFLANVENLDLDVIPMSGWTRSMRWGETGLDWIAPSPALASPDAALLYPATIYFEALSLSYGRGTEKPFQVIGAPWLDAEALRAELDTRDLAGIEFTATTITPQMLPAMTVEPAYLGMTLPAVELTVTQAESLEPVTVGLHVLDAVFLQANAIGVDPLERPEWLDQLSGGTLLRESLTTPPFSVDELRALHREAHAAQSANRASYLLYD